MVKSKTEVWAKDNKWRMVTIHPPLYGKYNVQQSWGQYDAPVDHFVKMFGGNLNAAMDGAWGSGTEKWYRDLDSLAVGIRIRTFRDSARRAGFKKLGEI